MVAWSTASRALALLVASSLIPSSVGENAQGVGCFNEKECGNVKRRMLFLVDGSLSIGEKSFRTNMMDLIIDTYCGLSGEDTEAGIVVFNKNVRTYLPFQKMNPEEFGTFVNQNVREQAEISCCTPHAEATYLANEMFNKTDRDDGYENVAFFVTDGLPKMNNEKVHSEESIEFYNSRNLDIDVWTQNGAKGGQARKKEIHYQAEIFPLQVKALIQNGIRLFFVGVPNASNKATNIDYFKGKDKKICRAGHCKELVYSPLVSEPAREHSFRAQNWKIKDIVRSILSGLCKEWTPPPVARPTVPPVTPPPTFARPPSISRPLCGSQDSLPSAVTEVCDRIELGDYADCCQALTGLDEEPMCREQQTGQPWCVPGVSSQDCNNLTKQHKLHIRLQQESAGEEESCCKLCQAYGDPECVSFDGIRHDWVLCDGRANNCRQSQEVCFTKLDHNGNTCLWNDTVLELNKGNNFATWGSPCVPDFSVSRPTMVLYSAPGHTSTLSMDERGTIYSIKFEMAAGDFTLQGDKCVDNQNDRDAAWGAVSLPEEFVQVSVDYFKESQTTEILWQVTDSNTGIITEVVCIVALSSDKKRGNARLNIRNVVEQDLERRRTRGFCATGVIAEVETSPASPTDNKLMRTCIDQESEIVCKLLIQPSCTQEEVLDYALDWCDQNYPNAADAKVCRGHMSRGDTAGMMRHYYCENLRVRGVFNDRGLCKSQMSRNGTLFVEQYGPFVPYPSCGSSLTDYPPRSPNAEKCVSGVAVEYFDENESTWHEVAFIPDHLPFCEGVEKLTFKGNQNPEVFTNSIRFSQCEPDQSCSMEARCRRPSTMKASVEFAGCGF